MKKRQNMKKNPLLCEKCGKEKELMFDGYYAQYCEKCSDEKQNDPFTPEQIARIKSGVEIVRAVFPGASLILYHATPEQISQIKAAGLSGISRKQRNS